MAKSNPVHFFSPSLEGLEERIAPAVDIILDFDGGTLASGSGYAIPPTFEDMTFSQFDAFAQSDLSPGNRTEQILQIIAGVREDFAPFDARVIWDDAGVNSPFFDSLDTVIMIVGEDPGGLLGIASSVDINQTLRDTGLTFAPAHIGIGSGTTAGTTTGELRDVIDTTSHEAGHNLGLSHSTTSDTDARQLVTTATQNLDLDSRFSPEILDHGPPETGIMYAETARLNANIGAAAVVPTDAVSGQTLPLDPLVGAITVSNNFGLLTNGSIDFAGDRDAYRFTATQTATYRVTQRANGPGVAPVVTVWSADGDFIAAGTGTVSTTTFDVVAGQEYYVVAGTTFDRVAGLTGIPTTGDYNIEITPSFLDYNSITGAITLTGDANNNLIGMLQAAADLTVSLDGVQATFPIAPVTSVTVNGGGGTDAPLVNLGGTNNIADLTLMGNDFNFTSPVLGTFDLTLSQTGTATFSVGNTSTYTGTTTLTSGTTLVNGTLDNSGGLVTVENGATLGGTGTVNRAVDIDNGGIVNPGDGPGVLTVGDTDFAFNAVFNVDLNGTTLGTEYDQLNVDGTLDLFGANLNVSLGYNPLIGDMFTIVDNDMFDFGGFFSGLGQGAQFDVGTTTFQINYFGNDGNDIVLTVTSAVIVIDGSGINDNFLVTSDGTNVIVTNNTAPVFSGLAPRGMVINGFAGDDTLTIENTLNQVTADITFNGGDDDDALSILDGTVTQLTYTPNAGSGTQARGTIDLDTQTITFTGLEPLLVTTAATTVTIDLSSVTGGETVTLRDDLGTVAGRSRVEFSTTALENMEFTNPTGLLEVIGNGNTINVQGLDLNFDANLTITGGATDTVNFQTVAAVLGTGNFDISAGSINVDVGITTDGGAVTLNADNDINVNASITTGGGAATLNADNDISFNAAGSLDSETGSTATLSLTADVDNVGGGGINLANGSSIDAWGGNLNLTATDDISVSLLRSSATTTVNSKAGSITDAGGTTDIDRDGSVVLLAATGIGTALDNLETTADKLEANGGTGGVFVDNAGDLEIGNIGATVGISSTGDVDISTTGTLTVSEASSGGTVKLGATTDLLVDADVSSVDTVVLFANNNVTVGNNATVRADSDDSSAGSLTISADDDNAGGGDLLASDGTSLLGTGVTLGGVNITVDGVDAKTGSATIDADTNVTLNDVLSAGTDIDVDATAGTLLQNAGNILAGGNVSLDGNAGITLNGTLGTGTPVGGDVKFNNLLAGLITLNGKTFAATGDQTYSRNVRLGDDTTITGATVTFLEDVNSAPSRTNALDIVGNLALGDGGDDAIGNTSRLSTLTVGGTTTFNSTATPLVTTSNGQTYSGAVLLQQNSTLRSTGGTIRFDDNVDGTTAGAESLTITGNFALGNGGSAAIGGTTELASLNVNGTTTFNSSAANTVTTTGTQTYTRLVTLQGNTKLSSTGAGNISFESTIDGNQALTVITGGTTIFNGSLGAGTSLASVTTDLAGTTLINAKIVRTQGGPITFDDPVTLAKDTTVTNTGASGVFFNNTLDSDGTPRNLTVNAVAGGTTRFGGTVGATSALNNLIANTAGTIKIDGGAVDTVRNQTYNGPIILSAKTTLSGENVDLNGGVSGGFGLVLSPTGTVKFASATKSTYTGTTTLTSGTTLVNGILDNSGGVVTVQNGATLGGAGTIDRKVQVDLGGTVAPGSSAGILSIVDSKVAANANFEFEINGPTAGTEYDQLKIAGPLNVSGTNLDVTLGFIPSTTTPFVPITSTNFTIIDNDLTDPITGTFVGLPEGKVFTVDGTNFQITYQGGDGNDVVLIFDATSPTVEILNAPNLVNDTPFTLTFQFSEAVTDFTLGDIRVGNGTASNLVAVDGDTYTAVITPGTSGDVTIDVDAGAALDARNNPSGSAIQARVRNDDLVPTVEIQGAPQRIINRNPFPITFQFSENVTGFGVDDINVVNGDINSFFALDANTYSISVSHDGTGNLSIDVPGGAAFDVANNPNTASEQVVIPAAGIPVLAVGADAGGTPRVRAYNFDGSLRFDFLAYDASFLGGVRVASGDINGDGFDDIITAAGAGGGPHVRIFSGVDASLIDEFFAYPAGFAGGVFVAVGDVNADGFDDIITGAGAGGTPHVRIFGGNGAGILGEFFAYVPGFTGGVQVAVGDVNGDGFADIVTGAGPGGTPHVKVVDSFAINQRDSTGLILDSTLLASFFAFDAAFAGGVFVAASDVNGDGFADVLTGAGAGGGPHVKLIDGTQIDNRRFDGVVADAALLANFFAYEPPFTPPEFVPTSPFTGGVRVGLTDLDRDGEAEIVTGAGPIAALPVRILASDTLEERDSFFAFGGFGGGVFVS